MKTTDSKTAAEAEADFRHWIEGPQTGEDGVPLAAWQELGRLVTANGGFTVSGWGVQGHDCGHQVGLGQSDAFALLSVTGYLHGVASVGLLDPFKIFIDDYLQRYLKDFPEVLALAADERLEHRPKNALRVGAQTSWREYLGVQKHGNL